MSNLEEEVKQLKAGLKQTSTGQARREAAAASAKTTTDTAVSKSKETETCSQDAVSTCNYAKLVHFVTKLNII